MRFHSARTCQPPNVLETEAFALKTHGLSHIREYYAFRNMHRRCTDSKAERFPHYGGRGVRVCKGLTTIQQFLGVLGLRPTPKHSIDRPDNDGHYSCGRCVECFQQGWPLNVRWATDQEQRDNKQRSHYIEIDGVRRTITQWIRINGLERTSVFHRIKNGWDEISAVTIPTRRCKRK
jgi:hypothetical protein